MSDAAQSKMVELLTEISRKLDPKVEIDESCWMHPQTIGEWIKVFERFVDEDACSQRTKGTADAFLSDLVSSFRYLRDHKRLYIEGQIRPERAQRATCQSCIQCAWSHEKNYCSTNQKGFKWPNGYCDYHSSREQKVPSL